MKDLYHGRNATHYWQLVDEVFMKIVQVARSVIRVQLENAVQGDKIIDLMTLDMHERVKLTTLMEHVRHSISVLARLPSYTLGWDTSC